MRDACSSDGFGGERNWSRWREFGSGKSFSGARLSISQPEQAFCVLLREIRMGRVGPRVVARPRRVFGATVALGQSRSPNDAYFKSRFVLGSRCEPSDWESF